MKTSIRFKNTSQESSKGSRILENVYCECFKKMLKATVNVISKEPPCKDGYA